MDLLMQAGVKNNHFTEMCSGSEAGSYLRLIDSCITELKAHGPSRTCNERTEEEEDASHPPESISQRVHPKDSPLFLKLTEVPLLL